MQRGWVQMKVAIMKVANTLSTVAHRLIACCYSVALRSGRKVTQVKTVTLTAVVEGSWKDTGVAALPGGSGFGWLVCRLYLGAAGLGV